MGIVIFDISMSLDGFIAASGMTPETGMGVGGEVLQGSLRSLAYKGRAISVGSAGRDRQAPDLNLVGGRNCSYTNVYFGASRNEEPERVMPMVQGHIEDVKAGKLRVVIDRRFPLAQAAAAHEYIESRQAFGRVVLVP